MDGEEAEGRLGSRAGMGPGLPVIATCGQNKLQGLWGPLQNENQGPLLKKD